MKSLTRKIVVVTGAAAGIGAQLVRKLCAENAVVVGLDINGDGLAVLAEELSRFGHELHRFQVDVTDPGQVDNAAAIIAATIGPIDVWINNAGISQIAPLASTSRAEFDRAFAINFRGTVNGTWAALTQMRERGSGTIVNLASIAGHVVAPYMAAYCASKHAIVGFTRSLQAELEMEDIPVHLLLVSPGFVDTGLVARGRQMGFPEWLSWMLARPEAVAQSVIKAIKRREREVYPTINGKVMLNLHRLMPLTTIRSSKMLLANSFKDFLLNRYQR